MTTSTASRTVRSMTGQGHAAGESELGTITVEVRAVNHRGFKCVPRLSDSLSSFESQIETLIRSLIHRGNVYVTVSWHRSASDPAPLIDTELLIAYCQQLRDVQRSLGEQSTTIDLAALMSLPGVVNAGRARRRDDEPLWEFARSVIVRAIENLNQMREAEGAHMADSLRRECEQIGEGLERIGQLAPNAVDGYRTRLESKIRRVLSAHQLDVQPIDLLREVQIYADRVDISEEVTRLAGHLKMFLSVLSGDGDDSKRREPTGRKLDFVTQEMFRETNTIGSKASDSEISAIVVEIKCAIERMRELVQNLE